MKKHKVKYTNEPIGKVKIVSDFLPSPKQLAAIESTKINANFCQTPQQVRGDKKD